MSRFILMAVVLFFVGCGSSEPFDFVQVYGKVTYEDGSLIPAKSLTLWFHPIEVNATGANHPIGGTALVDENGEFECVTSHKNCDGLIRGKHKVAIEGAKDGQGKPLVPVAFLELSDTPMVVNTDDVPLNIKVPRP